MKRTPIALLVIACGCVPAAFPLSAVPADFAKRDSELRAVIKDRQTSDEDLLQAISRMGKVTEKAEFWKDIADDPTYDTPHRRRVIFALFRRHGQVCTGVVQLARTIGPAKWLQEAKVTKITALTGRIPVDLNLGESVFSFPVLGGPSVYVRVLGDMSSTNFSHLLRQEKSNGDQKDGVILQFGFGDDYDDWLTENLRPKKQHPK